MLYKRIASVKKDERGDSNKEIKIFLEEDVNLYLNNTVKKLKDKGFAVDVISYMAERVSIPTDSDQFLCTLEGIFENVLQNKCPGKPYAVICIKKKRDDLIIHVEYNKSSVKQVFARLFTGEHLFVLNDCYRYDETGITRDEITLLYKCENAD